MRGITVYGMYKHRYAQVCYTRAGVTVAFVSGVEIKCGKLLQLPRCCGHSSDHYDLLTYLCPYAISIWQ